MLFAVNPWKSDSKVRNDPAFNTMTVEFIKTSAVAHKNSIESRSKMIDFWLVLIERSVNQERWNPVVIISQCGKLCEKKGKRSILAVVDAALTIHYKSVNFVAWRQLVTRLAPIPTNWPVEDRMKVPGC